jgi:hypothetical protein
MSFKTEFPKTDPIWKWSNPTTVRQKAMARFGKKATLKRSRAQNKKYALETPEGRTVNFGQMGYEDFTKHRNQTRRANYRRRSANIRGDWRKDPYSPNSLSRNLLW